MAGDPVIGHVSIYPWPPTVPITPMLPPTPQYGWVCPKCSRVHAPRVPGCFTCNKQAGKPPTITGDAARVQGGRDE